MFKKKDEEAKPIEQEIAELQRKFRVLENDKRACNEDSQATIRKQRATIEKLTRENHKMKAELNEARQSTGSAAENRMNFDKLQQFNEKRDNLMTKYEQELEQNRMLREKLDDTHGTIKDLKGEMAKMGGVTAQLDNDKTIQKQIRTMENRLELSLQKFSEAISSNKVLRDQIDQLRRERVVFDEIYRKLENELQQKKKEMANIIEQANSAYEARDQAQAQMAALKQQADREHVEFEKEWKDLGKLIENDKKMKEFMRSKVRGSTEGPAGGTEDANRKKIAKNAWDTAQSLVTITQNQDKVMSFEEAFVRIQSSTGICDIDELVQNFISAEDTNFSLYKYNNELQADIEKLVDQIEAYKEEYTVLSGKSSSKEDTEKTKLLATLEEKWADLDRKAVQYEVKQQESMQTLGQVRSGLQGLFDRVGAKPEDLPNGAGDAISEANMASFLAVIEQRATELVKFYMAMREDEGEEDAPKPSTKGATALQINRLPSTVEDDEDDDEDGDEDDQRPFTVEELKAKTKAKTKRQQQNKGKDGRRK